MDLMLPKLSIVLIYLVTLGPGRLGRRMENKVKSSLNAGAAAATSCNMSKRTRP
jgi:hypothetical protein